MTNASFLSSVFARNIASIMYSSRSAVASGGRIEHGREEEEGAEATE